MSRFGKVDNNIFKLVEFLHHGNTQIRQIGMSYTSTSAGLSTEFLYEATENLVSYSKNQPAIFKTGQLTPIRDLKLLVKDYSVCNSQYTQRKLFVAYVLQSQSLIRLLQSSLISPPILRSLNHSPKTMFSSKASSTALP